MNGFKDHFSNQASDYSRYRPGYPPELFQWLRTHCAQRHLAWDCATGSGQAALALAPHFDLVVATDASPQQLSQAAARDNIRYWVATAEASGLPEKSVDLISVAQAAHWFDHGRFYDEVRRVGRPGGLIALWTYGHVRVSPEVDEIIEHFYQQVVGPYWPPERAHVEAAYLSLPFPFEELATPELAIEMVWTLDQLLGYLATWSACERYKQARGRDPVEEWRQTFSTAWDSQTGRPARWPLHIRAGKLA